MGIEELQGLLDGLKRTLAAYEEAEREARGRLEQTVQGRLMQAGAVRGVEMAIEAASRVTSQAAPDPDAWPGVSGTVQG